MRRCWTVHWLEGMATQDCDYTVPVVLKQSWMPGLKLLLRPSVVRPHPCVLVQALLPVEMVVTTVVLCHTVVVEKSQSLQKD